MNAVCCVSPLHRRETLTKSFQDLSQAVTGNAVSRWLTNAIG